MKTPKPIYQGTLYRVIKRNGSFAVVLASSESVQYSGSKVFCIEWIIENDIQQAA